MRCHSHYQVRLFYNTHTLSAASKLYFPNIALKLVRSHLPPHQAVFKCPPQLSKLDISSLLTALYDLKITNVRTMNYAGKVRTNAKSRKYKRADYKKAIVTMQEDFVFPQVPEPKRDGVLEFPPTGSFGRNSSRKYRRDLEEYNARRQVFPEKKE